MKQMEYPAIQVYIMCFNRVEYIKQALDSVSTQSYKNFEIVISDNSTTDEIFEIFSNGNAMHNCRYVRRTPSLPIIDHHNKIISEVSAPFFMMFHDDDVLHNNALERLVSGFRNKNVVAVGANGFIIDKFELTSKLFNPYLKSDKVFSSSEDLAVHHLVSTKGIVPFPIYLYKTELVQKIRFNFKEGNKYADASFLLKLSTMGTILWLSDTLINYRKHMENASMNIDVRATLSLCRFVKHNFKLPVKVVNDFKMKQLSLWSLQKNRGSEKPISTYRESVIKRSSVIFLLKNPGVIFLSIKKKIMLKLIP